MDCAGFFEDHVEYEVSFVSWECWDVEDDGAFCAVQRVRRIQDETEARFFMSAVPPVGSGYWYQVRSRDLAGHWSDECAE